MRRYHVWLAVGGLAALASLPASLAAQGYSVNEHGTCAMGRAGTGVAAPCPDGSALFYNPAGIAGLAKGRTRLSLGGTAIAPSGGFTADATGLKTDLNNRVFPIPALYLAHGLSDRITIGLGVFSPYGLTTDWPSTSQVRYNGYKSVIRTIYVQPSVAAKLNDYVSVGAGFDVNFTHLQLRQRVDLAGIPLSPGTTSPTFGNLGVQAGTDFADVNLHGNGTAVGYHAGIIIKPSKEVSFGARYLARQKAKVKSGTAEISQVSTGITLAAGNPFGLPAGTPLDAVLAGQFTGAGTFADQGVSTALRLPEQWSFGVAVTPVDRLQLLFDVTLQHWSVFDTLSIAFARLGTQPLAQNWKNTTAYRFGADFAISDGTSIRGGYIYHKPAEPSGSVTPNLPEGTRSEFTGGFGTRLGGRTHLDLAYQYIDQADRRGRTVPYGSPDNGLFTFKAHLFGATVTFDF